MDDGGENKMRILIADDYSAIRTRLSAMLSELKGVEIIGPAADGHEALQLFQAFTPQCVVLDLQMPGMNGLQLLHSIRKQDANCRIIILTNYEDEAMRQCCLKLGANYFLRKSIEFEKVCEIIAETGGERL